VRLLLSAKTGVVDGKYACESLIDTVRANYMRDFPASPCRAKPATYVLPPPAPKPTAAAPTAPTAVAAAVAAPMATGEYRIVMNGAQRGPIASLLGALARPPALWRSWRARHCCR
jgi:hypothetical protein